MIIMMRTFKMKAVPGKKTHCNQRCSTLNSHTHKKSGRLVIVKKMKPESQI